MLKRMMGIWRWAWSGGGAGAGFCGAGRPVQTKDAKAPEVYLPIPGFDTTSIDTSVDPCNDFYKFACGKFAGNHPIPADQSEVDQFYALYNVNTQSLRGILEKAAAGWRGAVGGRAEDRRLLQGVHGHGCYQREGAGSAEAAAGSD